MGTKPRCIIAIIRFATKSNLSELRMDTFSIKLYPYSITTQFSFKHLEEKIPFCSSPWFVLIIRDLNVNLRGFVTNPDFNNTPCL